jgi:predicted alpha/beta-hydrolase family hydrolase
MAKPTLLLYPGAGSDRNQSSLVAIERALGSTASVERLDFPYRKQGRKAPDRAPTLMGSVRDDLASVGRRRGPVVMGGRSMGGRIASMVAADVDGGGPVARLAGLVLICYPLHPPGKPERLRVEHLVDLRVPCLFISGTRDPFGSPDELTEWTATIPGPVEHLWIEGGRHDLRGADDSISSAVVDFVRRIC